MFASGDGAAASWTTEAVVFASCCCCWMATDGAASWTVVFASGDGAASWAAVVFSWLAPSGLRVSAAAKFESVLRSFTYSCFGGAGSATASCMAAASAEENSAAVSPRLAGVRPMSASAEAPSPVSCGSIAVTEALTSRSASMALGGASHCLLRAFGEKKREGKALKRTVMQVFGGDCIVRGVWSKGVRRHTMQKNKAACCRRIERKKARPWGRGAGPVRLDSPEFRAEHKPSFFCPLLEFPKKGHSFA